MYVNFVNKKSHKKITANIHLFINKTIEIIYILIFYISIIYPCY